MNKKNMQLFRVLLIIFVAAAVGWAIPMGNLVLAFVFILLGVILSYVLRKMVVDVTEDERTYVVAGKAARMAMLTFLTIITLGGISLLALKGYFPEYKQAGLTMVNASCLLILLYTGFFVYFNRMHG
ncbi:DUF2178 domain-containing protein [Methanobacterium alcaliphilum]|uniref:DUF2178 domain-containing protein n=1 Tax=Methanobacterium alcaliphilum TaxID=392018 RepID=UPI00200A93BE|nr:DUF2178 domain-containing protein [Methanobacterium alcaliphilum]MCK9151899.1 DUF2178 domain-containing protein [Methanobacterium alcaliphilum]